MARIWVNWIGCDSILGNTLFLCSGNACLAQCGNIICVLVSELTVHWLESKHLSNSFSTSTARRPIWNFHERGMRCLITCGTCNARVVERKSNCAFANEIKAIKDKKNMTCSKWRTHSHTHTHNAALSKQWILQIQCDFFRSPLVPVFIIKKFLNAPSMKSIQCFYFTRNPWSNIK